MNKSVPQEESDKLENSESSSSVGGQMMATMFGIKVEFDKITSSDIDEVLDDIWATIDDDIDWVSWTHGNLFYAVMYGSIALRGKMSKIDGFRVVPAVEMFDRLNRNDNDWIYPPVRRSLDHNLKWFKEKLAQQFSEMEQASETSSETAPVARTVKARTTLRSRAEIAKTVAMPISEANAAILKVLGKQDSRGRKFEVVQ